MRAAHWRFAEAVGRPARVLRDGEWRLIAVAQLVRGDSLACRWAASFPGRHCYPRGGNLRLISLHLPVVGTGRSRSRASRHTRAH